MNDRQAVLTLSELVPHGRHVNPAYDGGVAGQVTPEDRPEASVHGTLTRFEKGRSASAPVQTFGWIKATYPDAIEYAGQKQALEGGIMVGTFFGVPFIAVILGTMFWSFVLRGDWFAWVLFAVFAPIFFLVGFWFLLFPLRHVWRTPRDLPIIFDRAHRKVYRMARQMQPGLKGLIKPWPVKAVAYEWDLVDAEHNSELIGSANSAQRLHRLVFLVRKSADDPTIIDSFEIGNGLAQTQEMVAPMYEHIRRFMEARSPHLPHASELLDERNEDLPSWWQACGRAGPWGDRYLWWWRKQLPMAVLHHVLVGMTLAFYWLILYRHGELLWWQALGSFGFAWISLSMVWGQGTGIWLMAHTSYRLEWPKAVYEAIGSATRKGRGW